MDDVLAELSVRNGQQAKKDAKKAVVQEASSVETMVKIKRHACTYSSFADGTISAVTVKKGLQHPRFLRFGTRYF